jgi:hypothetical protein
MNCVNEYLLHFGGSVKIVSFTLTQTHINVLECAYVCIIYPCHYTNWSTFFRFGTYVSNNYVIPTLIKYLIEISAQYYFDENIQQ